MKRIYLLLLIVMLLFCVGCTKTDCADKGHIYRSDIEIDDFAFLFDDFEYEPGKTTGIDLYKGFRSNTIKPKDIFNALGLPASTTDNFGVKEYTYLVGEQYDAVTVKYKPDEDIIDFDPSLNISEEYGVELLAKGDRTIDPNKYKMKKRFNISEEELSFIDESTSSDELQKVLGAPHYYIEAYDVNIEDVYANVFVYELENDNLFKVVYFRTAYIIRAWVEDSDGKQIKLLIDRDTSSYYEWGNIF